MAKPCCGNTRAKTRCAPDAATSTVPLYWYRDLKGLSAKAGMHRFTWDVHYQSLDGSTRLGGPTLPIAAIGYNTVPLPTTPWANPGTYTVRFTVNGKSHTQPIVVKADPRVKTPALAMQQIYTLSRVAYDEAVKTRDAATQARALRDQIAKVLPQATGATSAALSAYSTRLETLAGAAAVGGRGGAGWWWWSRWGW